MIQGATLGATLKAAKGVAPQMALTDTAIRNAKPQAKPYKLTDEKSLFLLVQPSGGKLWRFKFRVDGRDESGQPKRVEKKVGFGSYPDVNLKDARRMAFVAILADREAAISEGKPQRKAGTPLHGIIIGQEERRGLLLEAG